MKIGRNLPNSVSWSSVIIKTMLGLSLLCLLLNPCNFNPWLWSLWSTLRNSELCLFKGSPSLKSLWWPSSSGILDTMRMSAHMIMIHSNNTLDVAIFNQSAPTSNSVERKIDIMKFQEYRAFRKWQYFTAVRYSKFTTQILLALSRKSLAYATCTVKATWDLEL